MIQFEQRRDFGEKINATFTFVTEQIRGLGLSLLYIVGPVALIGGIISGYGQVELLGSATSVTTPDKLLSFYGSLFSGPRLLGMVLQFLAYLLTSVVTYSYIRLYREQANNKSVGVSAVWAETQQYIGSSVLLSIVTTIMMGFGFVILFIPGIYLWIVLSLAPAILVFERRDVGSSISRSFKLITDKWWSTFGLSVIMFIIIWIIGMVFALPASVIGFLFGAGFMKNISFLMTVLSAISTVGYSILLSLLAVAIAFQYFNLIEMKESTGLLGQIDSIGEGAGMSASGTFRQTREEEGEY
ncbi:hypothetical protein [Fibrella forsythiae]|uniref:Glycerophosphoryl diester phosphodiesterase membrane domain-containing protein n=1 Tax=Fibrella forsythiae TaxID=2817061 RepID=A0ABS3JFX9_9BACT|nr:hypothetical protein [Fibrella forsythiae]MBO0948904.1 hypothetical protein [Fibrella forsythiae]